MWILLHGSNRGNSTFLSWRRPRGPRFAGRAGPDQAFRGDAFLGPRSRIDFVTVPYVHSLVNKLQATSES